MTTVQTETTSQPLLQHPRHSPDGHAWGYGGSGPAQLALDILWDHLGYEPPPKMYQDFKFAVVANWPQDGDWTLSEDAISAWLGEYTATE